MKTLFHGPKMSSVKDYRTFSVGVKFSQLATDLGEDGVGGDEDGGDDPERDAGLGRREETHIGRQQQLLVHSQPATTTGKVLHYNALHKSDTLTSNDKYP